MAITKKKKTKFVENLILIITILIAVFCVAFPISAYKQFVNINEFTYDEIIDKTFYESSKKVYISFTYKDAGIMFKEFATADDETEMFTYKITGNKQLLIDFKDKELDDILLNYIPMNSKYYSPVLFDNDNYFEEVRGGDSNEEK